MNIIWTQNLFSIRMKVLFIIIIILIFIWIGYDLFFNGNQLNDTKYQDALKKIDNGDKWYYYKLKLKIFGIFLVGVIIYFIFRLIINTH
jgi:hypothetical protein